MFLKSFIKGYYWSIHPANMNDFKKGDFRRRQARLRAKHDKTTLGNSSGTTNRQRRSNSVEYNGNNNLQNSLQQNATFLESASYNQHQISTSFYNPNVASSNESNTNYSNINCVPHSIHHSSGASSNPIAAAYHHHPGQTQQYNYVSFPWLPAAAAAAAASTANNLLETITSSALACSYNTILQPHSYSASNDMCSDTSLYYHHNFHNK
jgi:hypothetical protein